MKDPALPVKTTTFRHVLNAFRDRCPAREIPISGPDDRFHCGYSRAIRLISGADKSVRSLQSNF
jgi:hypothetical protein